MRSVLHVLPHPGGGGETYVDALSAMDGYAFERTYLAPSTGSVSRREVVRNAVSAQRRASGHDVFHLHGEVAATLCLPALAMRPSLLTLHGVNVLRRHRGLARIVARANLRLLLRSSSRSVCVSYSELAEVRAAVGARGAARVVVIANGVDVPTAPSSQHRAALRSSLGIHAQTLLGMAVGALEPHKDPLVPARATLDLLRSGMDVALVFVGDGPLRADIETAAREAGGAIRVLGVRDDVRRLLAAADFFVLPSYREGLSFALLEAMAMGLPVVVSDVPGNLEAIGKAGACVPPWRCRRPSRSDSTTGAG